MAAAYESAITMQIELLDSQEINVTKNMHLVKIIPLKQQEKKVHRFFKRDQFMFIFVNIELFMRMFSNLQLNKFV